MTRKDKKPLLQKTPPRRDSKLSDEQIRADMLEFAKKHPQLGALHTLDPEQAGRQHRARKEVDAAEGDRKTQGEVAADMRNLEKKSVSYANLSKYQKQVMQDRTEKKAQDARTDVWRKVLFIFASLPFLTYLLSMYVRFFLEPAASRSPDGTAAHLVSFFATYAAGSLSLLSWSWEWDRTGLLGPDLLFVLMVTSAIGFGPFRKSELMDKVVAMMILGVLVNPLTTAVLTGVMSAGFSPQVSFVLKYPLVVLMLVAAAKASGLVAGPLAKLVLYDNRKEDGSKNWPGIAILVVLFVAAAILSYGTYRERQATDLKGHIDSVMQAMAQVHGEAARETDQVDVASLRSRITELEQQSQAFLSETNNLSTRMRNDQINVLLGHFSAVTMDEVWSSFEAARGRAYGFDQPDEPLSKTRETFSKLLGSYGTVGDVSERADVLVKTYLLRHFYFAPKEKVQK